MVVDGGVWWCVVLWSCFAEYQVCLVQTDTIISKFFSAANRYAFLMKVGCVVLRVASRKQHTAGHDMWFYPILRAYNPFDGRSSSSSSGGSGGGLVGWESSLLECHDHILIDEDLSNLKEVLMWCRANDDICRQIADNSKRAMVVLVVAVVVVVGLVCSSLFFFVFSLPSQAFTSTSITCPKTVFWIIWKRPCWMSPPESKEAVRVDPFGGTNTAVLRCPFLLWWATAVLGGREKML